MGVVAPNGHGLDGVRRPSGRPFGHPDHPEARANLGFACQVGGIPQGFEELRGQYFDHEKLLSINDNIGYAVGRGHRRLARCGLYRADAEDDRVDWDTGVIAGSGIGGMDTIARSRARWSTKGRSAVWGAGSSSR